MDLGPSSDRAVLDNPPLTEVSWLGPYPDQPGDTYEQRESVRLAFVAALQHLPGNQRAALLLFEVLDFSAAEIAEMMDTSTASVNSALQRARRIVNDKVPSVSQQSNLGDARVREIVTQFSTALERGDSESFIALLTEDVTWSMPPLRHWYDGIAAVTDFAVEIPLTRCPSWQHVATTANGQPATSPSVKRTSNLGSSRQIKSPFLIGSAANTPIPSIELFERYVRTSIIVSKILRWFQAGESARASLFTLSKTFFEIILKSFREAAGKYIPAQSLGRRLSP